MSPRAAITACVDSANDSFLVSQRWWTEGQCSERRCSHWCLSSRWASFGPPLPRSCADGKWVPRSHLMTFLWFHSALTKWSCHVNIFFFLQSEAQLEEVSTKKEKKRLKRVATVCLSWKDPVSNFSWVWKAVVLNPTRVYKYTFYDCFAPFWPHISNAVHIKRGTTPHEPPINVPS